MGGTLGVVGVDVLDALLRIIDERDHMTAGSRIRFAEADRCPEVFPDGITQNFLVPAAGVLDAVRNPGFLQVLLQAPGGSPPGMACGQAVGRREVVKAAEHLQAFSHDVVTCGINRSDTPARADSACTWAYLRWKPVHWSLLVRSRAQRPYTVVLSLVSVYYRGAEELT